MISLKFLVLDGRFLEVHDRFQNLMMRLSGDDVPIDDVLGAQDLSDDMSLVLEPSLMISPLLVDEVSDQLGKPGASSRVPRTRNQVRTL